MTVRDYLYKLEASDKPEQVMMEFYCFLFKKPYNLHDKLLMKELIKLYGKRVVFLTILDLKVVVSEIRSFEQLEKTLKRFLVASIKREYASMRGNQGINLHDLYEKLMEDKEQIQEEVVLPNIFEE